ncbi:MAG: helix-turn-helix transcriptional regulator [Lachnospiraceae bacterium]|jgi:transcriptional regulator with XRE-family HTH domain|nr:helix-turn-helix transcriptional regulator [Lachnospiraceae bacterium]
MNYTSASRCSTGARIRKVRQAAHMTQEKLADALGISVNYLGEVERGRKPLSLSLADQLCSLFNVTYDYLFHGIQPAASQNVRETCSYESLLTSLMNKISGCSLDELIVISQFVDQYLDAAHRLPKQEVTKNREHSQSNSDPQKGTPKLT